MKSFFIFLIQLIVWIPAITVYGNESLNDFDPEVYAALEAFNTPGIAIGVVVDGRVELAKGYGCRNVEKNLPVTENTLFALASGTKSFTSFLLGLLVDEGKISWDDPIQMYIPEFRLTNSEAFRPITLRDLLCHCSGIPRHDMLWYNASLKRAELLDRLSLLELNSAPGSKYQYNNLAFTVAGMVVERVTGQSWEEALESRILAPLSMDKTNTSVEEMESSADYSLPYVWTRKGLTSIPARSLLTAPSSSMNASVSDMCKWLQLLLNLDEEHLISKSVFDEISTPQIENCPDSLACFHPQAPGLGWMIGQYEGELVFYHGGYTEGFVSLTAVLPNRKIGLTLLCNTSSAHFHLITTLTHSLLHRLLGLEKQEWMAEEKVFYDATIACLPVYEQTEETVIYFRNLEGHYENPAYGNLEIRYREGHPYLLFHNIEFGLNYKQDDTFTVISLVPAFPFFRWEGKVTWNRSTNQPELLITFEPAANPLIFSRP